jgi:hypothetical protein
MVAVGLLLLCIFLVSCLLFSRVGAATFLLYVVPRFAMYTASALESWANLRKET